MKYIGYKLLTIASPSHDASDEPLFSLVHFFLFLHSTHLIFIHENADNYVLISIRSYSNLRDALYNTRNVNYSTPFVILLRDNNAMIPKKLTRH